MSDFPIFRLKIIFVCASATGTATARDGGDGREGDGREGTRGRNAASIVRAGSSSYARWARRFVPRFPRRWKSDDSFLDSRVGGNRTIDRSIAMAGGLTRAAEALRMATTSGSGIEAGAATTSAPRMIVDFAGQLTGFFTFTYEGVCWAIVAALFATNWLSRTWRRRLRKNLANAEMKHTLDSQFTTVEHGAMEWINHFLRHLWGTVAGSFADQQATDVLRGIIEGLGSQKPSFVKEVELTGLTLGTVPPTIRVYTVRYNPTLDYIQFELDVDWFADAAHGRLVAKIKLASALPSLRVPIHLTDFGLRGRILLGMRLTKRMPGVSGVDISFRGVPKVDVSVRPVGLPVADVPGLYQWIMGKIEEVICKKFLEPRRLYVDVEGKFLAKMAGADFLGPGGTLVCRVISVKGMPSENTSGYPWVEVSFNGVRRKTATRPLASLVEYGGALVFPLPSDTDWKLTVEDDTLDVGTVRVRILDRGTVGGDVYVLGEAVFGAHRRSDTGTHHVALSLGSHTKRTKYGKNTKVSTIAQIEWEVLPPIERWNPLKPAVVETRASVPLKHESVVNAADEDAEDGEDAEDDEDGGMDEFDGSDVMSGDSVPSDGPFSPPDRRLSSGSRRSSDGEPSHGEALGATAEHIFQLAKLRLLLQDERERSEGTIKKLRHEVTLAKDTLKLERERRAQELKRALLDGVKFYCHSKSSKGSLKGKETFYLRYHGAKQEFTLHRKHGVKARSIHAMKIANVSHASLGTRHFTMGVTRAQSDGERLDVKTARAREIQGFMSSNCFTILFADVTELERDFEHVRASRLEAAERSGDVEAEKTAKEMKFELPSDLTSVGMVGLDLEVPIKGNGRSAREWVDGINTLRQVYIATEFPELEKQKKSPSGTKSHERRNSANSNRSSVTDEIEAKA